MGRYVLLEQLGSGGMGTVYAAYDPELNRRVALKFLRGMSARPDLADWKARFTREAQAMARLSHPNVVTVYDVGASDDGRMFLAMEMVEGGTLGRWLDARKRSWREIVRTFCEAGEGLAAAHRAGLIHRDFKLENVLIGDDERPRVTDFGIARFGVSERSPHPDDEASAPTLDDGPIAPLSSSDSLSANITATGSALGTPGYMAPEQYLSPDDIDARVDIFAFCAALYRALYGQRAYEGNTVDDIEHATLSGKVGDAPKGSDVPAWIRRALLRGLSLDRNDRPGSMPELLAALRADPAKRRRRWLASALLLAGGLAAAWGVHVVGARRVRACHVMADRLGGVWDAPRKEAIAAAFRATHTGYASGTWARIEPTLDAYAASWSASMEDACMATRVRGEQSETMLELRSACLDERLDDLRALSDVLAAADDKVVEKAVQAAHDLSPLRACSNVDRLSASTRVPTDPAARSEVRTLQGEVAAAKALLASGKQRQSLERLRQMGDRVEGTHYGPLIISRAILLGPAEGDPKVGAEDYERAVTLAEEYRLDEVKAGLEIKLGDWEGETLAQYEDGHRWLALAHATIARIGGDAALEAKRDVSEGFIYFAERKLALAAPLFQRALDRAQSAHLDDALLLADAHTGLAGVLSSDGRFDEALDHARAAVRAQEETYGADHPYFAVYLNNLATMQLDSGRLDDAFATASRVLTILEGGLERGDFSAASGRLGLAHHTMGDVLLRQGRAREAAEHLARARDLYRETGEQEDYLAIASNGLAEALRLLGRVAEARDKLDDAAGLEEKVKGIPGTTVAGTLAVRAKIALDQRKPTDALPLAERALASLEDAEPEVYELADMRLLLARALVSSGRDEARARLLAEQARDAFAKLTTSRTSTRRRLCSARGSGKRPAEPLSRRVLWRPS
jgi:tetratricopeptide (TPR) repeat protein